MLDIARPKSSPSRFGPNGEDIVPMSRPEDYSYREYQSMLLPLSPPTTSNPFVSGSLSTSQHFSSAPSASSRHAPVPIAPNPLGLQQLKRSAEESESVDSQSQRKRKRTASSPERPVELTEEEKLLLKLKEEENLPWKDIALRFQTDLGKTYQVPALQMRFKRLRERIRAWTDTDVSFHRMPLL